MGKFKEMETEKEELMSTVEYYESYIEDLRGERDEYLADLITLLFMIKHNFAAHDVPFIKTLEKKLKKAPRV